MTNIINIVSISRRHPCLCVALRAVSHVVTNSNLLRLVTADSSPLLNLQISAHQWNLMTNISILSNMALLGSELSVLHVVNILL